MPTAQVINDAAADFLANATMLRSPVQRGLTGIFSLGGTADRSVRNLAADALPSATVVGAPTFSAGFVSTKSKSNYLQTLLHETDALTIMLVVRSAETFASSANIPCYASAYGTDPLESETTEHGLRFTSQSTAPGSTPPTFALRGSFSMNSGGAITSTGPTLGTAAQNTWRCISLSLSAAGVGRLRNLTAGLTVSANGAGAREANATELIRLGSDGSGSFAGTCDMAESVHAAVDWTTAEEDAVYAWLKARCALKGIAI